MRHILALSIIFGLTACSVDVPRAPLSQYQLYLKVPVQGGEAALLTKATSLSPEVQLTPRVAYKMTGRLLLKNRYWSGDLAKAIPYDFVMGWNKMADTGFIRYANVSLSQSNRTYRWEVPNMTNLRRSDFVDNSANVHMVPSSTEIFDQLDSVKEGDMLYMEGMLVDVTTPKENIRTSLTRQDEGAGSCEIFYVTKIIKLV